MNKNITEIRKDVERDIKTHFKKFFTEYNLPDNVLNYAIDDVMETSAIEDEGFYNLSDISLGCQRALINKMGIGY